jgi:purine-binding chemotaxis protein CheW
MMRPKHRPDPHKSLVGFKVGEVSYAIAIQSVREIINPAPLTVLPHLPPAIAGVTDHRGTVIPVIDLRARFGVPKATEPLRVKWILIDAVGQDIGLIVDSVTEVFGTGGEELKPAPNLGGNEDSRAIQGVVSHNGRLVFVLRARRFEELIAEVDMEAISDELMGDS